MDDWLKSQLKTHCAGAKPTQKGMTKGPYLVSI